MTNPDGPPDVIPDISVNVRNWPKEWGKPPRIARTTVKTYVIDPAGNVQDDNSRRTQISEYEPNRVRMEVHPIDASVMLCTDIPTTSPDVSTATVPGTGRYLPVESVPYCFYGPDAFWINSLTAATRVTVTKEYC